MQNQQILETRQKPIRTFKQTNLSLNAPLPNLPDEVAAIFNYLLKLTINPLRTELIL